jgi:hypothetical protein
MGARAIRSELLMHGIEVAQSTVAKYMERTLRSPSLADDVRIFFLDLLKINLLSPLWRMPAIQGALLHWAWNRRTSIEVDS